MHAITDMHQQNWLPQVALIELRPQFCAFLTKTVEFAERPDSATQVCCLTDVGVGRSTCPAGASVTDGHHGAFHPDTPSLIRVPTGGHLSSSIPSFVTGGRR